MRGSFAGYLFAGYLRGPAETNPAKYPAYGTELGCLFPAVPGLLSVLVESFEAVSQYKGGDGIRVATKDSKA